MRATPGAGTKVPLWILGSSIYGAQLAAMLGLPYAFASHFAPDALLPALAFYREKFEPSEQLRAVCDGRCECGRRPHRRGGAPPLQSAQQSFTDIFRGRRGQLPPPIDDIEDYWTRLFGQRLEEWSRKDERQTQAQLRGLLALARLIDPTA